MGSLPNLHELGRDHFTLVNNHHHYHPQRPNHVPIFTEEERTKILHRYSEHSRLRKIRNSINGNHDFRLNCDDLATTTIDGGGGGGGTTTTTTISTPYSPTTSTHLKRKDSLSSSIGATSVRRLLAIVRPSTITTTSSNQMMMINHHRHHNHHHHHHHDAAVNYSKRILLRNFLIFCINHLIITATFLPFLTLQTSITIWWTTIKIHLNQIYYGSLLLSIVYLFASISVLFGPYFLHKFTTNLIFLLSYLIFICYYFSHLYPIIYLLLPISIIFGIFYGLLYMTQYIYLMILSTKLCYHNNIDDNNEILDDDDVKFKRKICIIRRLARCYQAANDIGLIIGSLLTTLLIQHTISLNNQNWRITDDNNGNDTNFINFTTIPTINSNNRSDEDLAMDSYNTLLDNLFDTYEGARLCGAQACPRTITNLINQTDLTIEIDDNNNNIIDTNNNNNNNSNNFKILPNNTTIVLSIIYGCLSILTTILTIIGLDRIHTFIYQDPLERPIGLTALKSIRESFRDARLRLAAPLALFIGFEQAFIYADFAKSYVICTLGIQQLNLVFLSMGVLQAIAATTLSMLIKSIRRYYVVGVGFTFHACLLMVLILWKPIEDDPGLFYVISAAWGVCNAIWEILNFSLLTNCFTDNWESAFANLAFYRFLGLSLSFFFHGFLCNYYKLYLLSFLLVVAVVPFVWLELRLENLRKIKNMTRL